ncbi:hypothetical protein FHX74_002632 [Friedmanniella endophytica]|uniref:4-amino-4-deoxy-L-arabinose transferase n=1 Tax=Microlunatus kandeliicorticis TaxID=1759536 RepID=A0A7W3ITM4_9ACTN|nr:glycosyltransferase 87 family protein [Microlunatus kandeliicorticis]MBA8795004.1 hypothetical protein [Microlunatus kandeliicorticis]
MDSTRPDVSPAAPPARRLALAASAVAVGVLAFLVRLVPVLRGPGGLTGVYAYDDGVHFGAALALVQGRLPYRDLLFLQPPGIVLALSPFGWLAQAVGDREAFVWARLTWMLLGALIAAGVCLLLRRAGTPAALAGGAFYAVYWPSVVSEWTTMLEGLANVFVVAALLLAGVGRPADRRAGLPGPATALLAGVCLGICTAVKIWGVLFVLVLVGSLVLRARAARGAGADPGAGRHAGAWCLLGAAVGGAACGLPFLLAAPAAMWRMVVSDQLGRPADRGQPFERLGVSLGMPARLVDGPSAGWLVGGAGLVALVVLVLAARDPRYRVAPVLAAVFGVLLVAAPSFYPHYAGVLGVPLAVSLGAALGVLRPRPGTGRRRRSVARAATAVFALVLVGAVGWTGVTLRTNAAPGPDTRVVDALRSARGCVTADTPGLLIRADVFSRNLDRGCRTVVDVTGYAYDLDPGGDVPRVDNQRFADAVLGYLRSGEVTVVSRLRRGGDLSTARWQVIEDWPVVVRSGRYVVRSPR